MKKLNFKNYKGFTLIEMLVVVLIIGILAGVALPQYTNAVRKARVAEAKITLRTWADGIDRYLLKTGTSEGDGYPSLDKLDIEIQTNTKNWTFGMDECVCGENGLCGCGVDAWPKWEEGYQVQFWTSNYDGGTWEGCGKFICLAEDDNGHKICKSLGGKLLYDYGDGTAQYKL